MGAACRDGEFDVMSELLLTVTVDPWHAGGVDVGGTILAHLPTALPTAFEPVMKMLFGKNI